ncbi:MAG: UDP-N-acetylmuramoyl-L-alanine--D-glutamate ligase [Acidimicrobiia bacterium]
MSRLLLIGRGRSAVAVEEYCARAGLDVTVHDDAADGEVAPDRIDALLAGHDLVVPSPAVSEHHPLLVAALSVGIPVRSEVDLAAELTGVPFVAITGTNGKSTVTTVTTAMLAAHGMRAVSAGNIGRPFLDAVTEPADVYVVEVSSFQLRFTTATFQPAVAVWTNLAPDHLDWHRDLVHYVAAKAQIFEHQRPTDCFVFNADDRVVAGAAASAPSELVAFSLRPQATTSWHCTEDAVVDPDGRAVIDRARLGRRAPFELANIMAAAAAAQRMGADPAAITAGAINTVRLPHRMASVGKANGVEFIDDSKATNPHAALASIAAFPSVVLVAGGYDKGLDLSSLATQADHIRAVVAIGDAAPAVADVFDGVRPVATAASMSEAVTAAGAFAEAGDVVLLAPACASFDWYSNYGERGDDFAAEVSRYLAAESS